MSQDIIRSVQNLAAVKPFINLKALNRNNNPILAAIIEFVDFGHADYLSNIVQNPHRFSGWQLFYKFPNGYGASVTRYLIAKGWGGSYGAEDGLWQLAVLNQSGHPCYNTSVTDDVLGNLTPEEVKATLAEIMNLPPYQEGDDSSPDEGDFFTFYLLSNT